MWSGNGASGIVTIQAPTTSGEAPWPLWACWHPARHSATMATASSVLCIVVTPPAGIRVSHMVLSGDLIEPSTKCAVCFAIWIMVVHMSSARQLIELDTLPVGSSGAHVVSRHL